LGFTSCWSMQMHLVPTGHWKKKACDLCVWWLLIDCSWRGTMALNFHCWGRCPYHCVARDDATYYSLFFPHHLICLMDLIRQLSCGISLSWFNCWGRIVAESIG
jgi:hypothetical protein